MYATYSNICLKEVIFRALQNPISTFFTKLTFEQPIATRNKPGKRASQEHMFSHIIQKKKKENREVQSSVINVGTHDGYYTVPNQTINDNNYDIKVVYISKGI